MVITGDLQNGFLANGKLTLQNGRVSVRLSALADFCASGDRNDSRPHRGGHRCRRRSSRSRRSTSTSACPISAILPSGSIPMCRGSMSKCSNSCACRGCRQRRLIRRKFPLADISTRAKPVLASLVMKNGKTDFKYRGGDWSVDNLTASTLEGHLSLNIVGRQEGRLDPHLRQSAEHERGVVIPAQKRHNPRRRCQAVSMPPRICGPIPTPTFSRPWAEPPS